MSTVAAASPEAAASGVDDLRPSEFNAFVDSWVDERILAFNTLTGRLVALSPARFADVRDVLAAAGAGRRPPPTLEAVAQGLRQDGFLVPAGFDERAEVRRRYHEVRASTRGLSITLAPTVSCNFRCGYCFQEHPNRRMDDDEAERIRAYVEGHLEQGTSLSVTWFGGEPLLAFALIRRLAGWLEAIAGKRSCRVTQSIITNGLLLDDEKVAFFAGLPSFDHAQVTLDGPGPVHDRRRPTVGGTPTFARILERIVAAAGRIRIHVRVNVDRTNCGELDALVAALEEAGLRNRVFPYLGHTTDYTEVCAGVAETILSREEFAEIDVAFRLHLLLRGWRGVAPLPRPQVGSLCVADHPNGVVLAPGGAAFRCWNEAALPPASAATRLAADGTLEPTGMADAWGTFDPFTHAPCQTCRAQPLCRGGCPWEARKNADDEPGNCVTSRFVLADQLRLHDLEQALHRGVDAAVARSCQ